MSTSDPIAVFSSFAGEAAELISFNRSVGQLYGALFISGKAMSLKELAVACKMSKGNASVHLRILEEWGAVQRSNRPGTREDYYVAEMNLSELFLQRLRQGLSKRLHLFKAKMAQVKEKVNGDPAAMEKLAHVEELLQKAESFISVFQKFSKLQDMFAFGSSKDSKETPR